MNWLQRILVKNYENKIKKRLAKAEEEAQKSHEEATQAVLDLNKHMILEDKEGREYTKERLEKMTHQQLIELLEHYNNELRKETGEEK